MNELYDKLVSDDQIIELRGRKYTKKGLRNYKLLEILLVEYLRTLPNFNLDEVIKDSGLEHMRKDSPLSLYTELFERNCQGNAVANNPKYMNLHEYVVALGNGYIDNIVSNEVEFENVGVKFHEIHKDEYEKAIIVSDMYISSLLSEIKGIHKNR